MRYAISNFAVLATSLLVKDVFASPLRVRDLYVETDSVIVTEEVYITEQADGSYATGAPSAIATVTIDGTAVLVPETTTSVAAPSTTSVASVEAVPTTESTSSTSTSVPVADIPTYTPPVAASTTASASTTSVAPILLEVPTTSAVPTTTSVAAVVVPSTTSTTPIVQATLATVVVASSTSTTASAVATSTASSSSKKRGLAYNAASLCSSFVSSDSQVSWAYNWGSTTSTIDSALEYVPMLWGLTSGDISNWNSAATKAIAAGSTHLLAFNEPDLAAQANLGYAAAAAGYLTYMEPFAGKAKLVSPAVTNGGGEMGLTWLGNFLTSCSTCTVDAIAIHWYNGGDATAFKEYIAKAYTAGGNRPVWVTEFQFTGTDAEVQAFLEDVMPWMDASSMVDRYAYFMVAAGNLISSGTTLSAIGNTFATYV